MNRTKCILLAIPFAGGVSIASFSPAVAQTNTYPGLMCVETRNSNPEIYYLGGGGMALNNNGTYEASFACPIPRHDSDLAGDLTLLYVRVTDKHPTESVRCHATSCNALGTTCEITPNSSSTSDPESLYLGSLPTFTSGQAYLYCYVPDRVGASGRSGVISYRATD